MMVNLHQEFAVEGRVACTIAPRMSAFASPQIAGAAVALAALLMSMSTAFAAPTIEIVGNQRTQKSVIVSAADLSDDIDEASLALARQRIMNLRLFETVEIVRADVDGAPVITIKVKERWTLFPIPFVSSSSRGTNGGVFVLDTNLFGLNKLVAVGGSYASWGGAAVLLYQDPSVAGTRATLRFSASYAKNDRERRIENEIVDGYEDERTEVSLLSGYRVTPRLTLSAGWHMNHIAGEPTMDTATGVTAGGWNHGPMAMLEYRGADFKMYYDDGLTASLIYKQAREELGAERNVLDVLARAQYTRALLPGQATTLSAQVDFVDGDRILDTHFLGGRSGTRGFEQLTLWADRAATLTLDHQVPFFARGWGIWTAAAFVDVGRYQYDGDASSFVTPGAGIRLYLPRMNFPAVGFDVSYSLDSEKLFFAASVGLAM